MFIIRIARFFVIQIIYPLCEITGRIIPSLRSPLEKKFIAWNNACVVRMKPKISQVLILIPHCLQFDACVHRITTSVSHCKGCGKCVIKEFSDLEQKQNIPIRVATGGTIARRWVKETKPDIIIACACERDLSSGIYDSYPVLVWGIFNERPFGPCINTTVDVEKIEEALQIFCKNTDFYD